jgi:Amylo-alpha-1,6-glucosidase
MRAHRPSRFPRWSALGARFAATCSRTSAASVGAPTCSVVMRGREAWRARLEVSGDRDSLVQVFPTRADIVEWHPQGTWYGIHVDPQDALLGAGEPGVQLTWPRCRDHLFDAGLGAISEIFEAEPTICPVAPLRRPGRSPAS